MSEPAMEEPHAPSRSLIHRVVTVALEAPVLVLVLSVVVGAFGVWSFSRLPVDA